MSQENQHSEIAFVGTGPITLLKAYLTAKKNPESRITLFDMMGDFGGAWYSDQSPKEYEIECGCHIWSYTPEVYKYMEKELGLDLDYFRPTPLFVGKSVKIPYSTKNLIDSYKYITKNLLTFRWGNLNLSEKPHVHWKLFGKRNKYPKTGSPELIHALHRKLKELSNVDIKPGVTLKRVILDDRVKLYSDTETYETDHLFMTSVSKLESVTKDGHETKLNPRQVDYNHLLMSLNQPLAKKVSYWRFVNDPAVHRITDISYQTGNEELLLLAGIKPDAFNSKSPEELLKVVRDLMEKHKLLNASHELELIKVHHYPTFYSDAEARNKIADLDDRLTVLHTTDLIYGMYYLLREEKLI